MQINVKKINLSEFKMIEVTNFREIQEIAKILGKPILKYKEKNYVIDNFVAYSGLVA